MECNEVLGLRAMVRAYLRKLEIWDSDWGRSEGWYLEFKGEPIAHLIDSKYQEMFWESYVIVPLERAKELGLDVQSVVFWRDFDFKNLRFRSVRLNEYAESPFPAGSPMLPDKRVLMRALYIHAKGPNWWDDVALAIYTKRKPQA